MKGDIFWLRTFGGLSLETDKGPVRAMSAQKKRLVLLAMLATAADEGLAREKLLGYLWPESDTEQGRNSLSQLLYGLRRELGIDAIVGNGQLRLNLQVVNSDVAHFQQALRNGDLAAAHACYRGPFLDGIYLRGLEEFERWVEDHRARYALEHARALEGLAQEATQRGLHAEAAEWWKKRAVGDLLSARVARELATSLSRSGDRAAALKYLAIHTELVRAELRAEPDPTISRMEQELRVPVEGLAVRPADVDDAPNAGAAPDAPDARDASNAQTTPATSAQRVVEVTSPRGLRRRLLVGAFTLIAAAGLGIVMARSITALAAADNSVMVIPLQLESGDAVAARVSRLVENDIATGIAAVGVGHVTLTHGDGFLSGVRERRVANNDDDALAVARGQHVRYVLLVATTRDGDSLSFRARLLDVPTGRMLRVVPTYRADVRNVDGAVAILREHATGAIASVLDPRVASTEQAGAAAPTYAAYAAFAQGLTEFESSRYGDAASLFKRAHESDSAFVNPVVWSVFALASSSGMARRDSLIAWLENRQQRLTLADQFGVRYFLAQRSADELGKLEALRAASAAAPGSVWSLVLSQQAARAGNLPEALKAIETVDPFNGWARGYDSYWRAAYEARQSSESLQAYLKSVQAARAVFPRLPILAWQEVFILSRLGRTREMRTALSNFLAVDWGDTMWGPPNLMEHLLRTARDSASRQELARECIDWFDVHGVSAALGKDYRTPAQQYGICLYAAGNYVRAATVLREVADTFDRRATGMADTSTSGGGTSISVITLRSNRIEVWAKLGEVEALRGNRAEAERILGMLPTLPPPNRDEFRGYYYEYAAAVAAALGDRATSIDLATRAMQNGDRTRGGRKIMSILSPAIARYRNDTAVLAAFGLVGKPR